MNMIRLLTLMLPAPGLSMCVFLALKNEAFLPVFHPPARGMLDIHEKALGPLLLFIMFRCEK